MAHCWPTGGRGWAGGGRRQAAGVHISGSGQGGQDTQVRHRPEPARGRKENRDPAPTTLIGAKISLSSMKLAGYAVAFLVAASFAGCLTDDETEPDGGSTEPAAGLRFLVIGDQGTGAEAQFKVADAMAKVCKARGCDFVITNGDNMYEAGVESPEDPRFDHQFEEPYAALDMPFFLTLGNHDNDMTPAHAAAGTEAGGGLGAWGAAGDHQVAYTFREDRASDKWNMPARYYTFTMVGGDGTSAQFIALDTSPFLWDGMPPLYDDLLVEDQVAWAKEAVGQPNGTWRFSFGHHPYRSNGQHDDAGSYDGFDRGAPSGERLQAMYEEVLCNQMDVFFAGHDHDLQWLEPRKECGKTQFIVSGAGAKQRTLGEQDNPAYFQQGSTLGFLWVELQGDEFTGIFYDANAAPLFKRSFTQAAS